MGAKGSVEAAKMNADGWGHLEVCCRCCCDCHCCYCLVYLLEKWEIIIYKKSVKYNSV